MKQIIPHLWFDTQAKVAATLYASLFSNSKIENITTITDTPSGNCDIVSFNLSGLSLMSISAGPHFKLNPSISFFVTLENEDEINKIYTALSNEGSILMPYDTYPWAKKYVWLQDKYGVSWQLSLSENHQFAQKITPFFMFTGPVAGKAKEALSYYTSLFPNSKIDAENNNLFQFTINNQHFMSLDSPEDHKFNFNEAFSLIVKCETQEEINYYWEKLSAVPEAEQCGWLKDKYGVSWQITPTAMDEMLASGDAEKTARVTQAFLKMKKFDIKTLEEAYNAS